MATMRHILAVETTGRARGGSGKGSKGRMVGLVATAALGLSLLVGGAIGQGRQVAPAEPQSGAAQLSSAAQERALNLLREQNALPELAPDGAIPGILPGPATFFGEDH